jgi:HEAT repeat protein
MDSDSQQRSLILAAISEIGMRSLKPMNRALIISLQDESSDVRKNAIRDLTRIYDQVAQMTQLLGHAANDSDAEVQETARWALSQLNRIRASGGDSGPLLPNTSTQDYLPGDKPTS